jgi:hypothetical protein
MRKKDKAGKEKHAYKDIDDSPSDSLVSGVEGIRPAVVTQAFVYETALYSKVNEVHTEDQTQ